MARRIVPLAVCRRLLRELRVELSKLLKKANVSARTLAIIRILLKRPPVFLASETNARRVRRCSLERLGAIPGLLVILILIISLTFDSSRKSATHSSVSAFRDAAARLGTKLAIISG
jgi:hypothetical protein